MANKKTSDVVTEKDVAVPTLLPKTIEIRYADGRVVHAGRIPVIHLGEAALLCQHLLAHFLVKCTYATGNPKLAPMGDLLCMPDVQDYINKLGAMVPVVGQKEPGLEMIQLSQDYEQLCWLFFSESINLNTGYLDDMELISLPDGDTASYCKASAIARLNQLNFFRVNAEKEANQLINENLANREAVAA